MAANPSVYFLLLVCTASAQTFRLESEKRETYGISGKSEVFTAYDYDANGKRAAKRSFEGSGMGGPALGATTYHYDGPGRLVREVTVSGLDTLTDAAYEYGLLPKPVKIIVRGAAGKLRYTDNFAYDASGNLLGEWRVAASGAWLFERHYGYDGSMRLIADTLFESDGVTSWASQIRAPSYNGDGKVSGELHSRFSDGGWFAWKKVAMSYAAGKLIGVAAFEGSVRTDSLAIQYDGSGNRSQERRFDEDGSPIDAVFFTWSGVPVSIRRSPAAKPRIRAAFVLEGARYDLRGRRLQIKANTLFVPFEEPR